MKKIALLLTVLLGFGTMASAQATGSGMGGNPTCKSGGVNVGHAPCGK